MSRKTMILSGFILLKVITSYLLINPSYDLHRDEYLHLDQARHLAWGYESVPPFTSWISWVILQLGNSTAWVKFFPALFGALSILIVWKTIEKLNGGLYALILGAIAMTLSVIPRINILYQPNSFDILSWIFLYYCVVCFIKTEKNKWLYFAAIGFAIGFLNKYNIVFSVIGLLPAFLLTDVRKVFLQRHLYFAAILALLIIFPNLLWQYQNDFPVFRHLKELSETQLVHVRRADFFKEQLFFFFNTLFLLVIGIISFFTYKPFRIYRLFFFAFVIKLFSFACFHAKSYYAIGLYPVLLAFGAVYFERLTYNAWKRKLRPLAVLLPIVLFVPLVKEMFPVESPQQIVSGSHGKGLHRWEDGKEYPLPQDFADMLGWRELAEKTDSIYILEKNKSSLLVFCDNYGQAGAINYYSKCGIQAVSLNADYVNWFKLDQEITRLILIKEKKTTDMSIENKLFAKVVKVASIENRYARENGTGIFICSEPRTRINDVLKNEIYKRHGSIRK